MKITERLLKKYVGSRPLVRLKARFLLFVYAALLLSNLFVIAYTTYFQANNPHLGYSVDLRLLGITSGTFLLIIGCAVLLVRGYFSLAAHATIIILFTALWSVIVFDRSEIMSRLDTIVLVLAFLSCTPLITSRKRIVVVLYSGLNLAAFYTFMVFFRGELNLSAAVFYAHLADITLAFLFIGFITYNIFTVNNSALEQVEESNGKLERAYMELQAAMEELTETNEEFEAQNEELIRSEEEREQAWTQLVQAQKMEAVGTLAGGIAHDFNNMLGGIMGSIGMVELLLEKDDHPRRESILKFVETAREASHRAADMTRQMLTLSRKSELKLAPVDINMSMKHVEKLCASSFPKSVNLDFDIGEEPLRVHADPVQIEQVLLNLCVNASHAMTIMRPEDARQGGTISVRAESNRCDGHSFPAHPDVNPDDMFVRIRVSDSGVGMDEDTRRNMFDPFYTTKESGEGTGLGLAITYSIVKQHGGFIDVVSAPGKGSTFTVCLPALSGEVPQGERKPESAGIVPGSGRVLVIDDEATMLQVAEGMLEYCGYSVIKAGNHADAVDMYRREKDRIDGVLLDFSMPATSGLEIYDQLREIKGDVRVLLSSGFIEGSDLQKALGKGIQGFIQKPYSADDLSSKMKEVLG